MLQAKALPITRHDYEEMPAGPPYYQVIEGDLVMSPSPNIYHQAIVSRRCTLLLQFLEKRPLGEAFVAPLDVFLSEINVYQADVVFVSNQRRSILTEHGLEGAPDLAVEVLSPSTARFDKRSKRKVYARTGVRELWLVDGRPSSSMFTSSPKMLRPPRQPMTRKQCSPRRICRGCASAQLLFSSPPCGNRTWFSAQHQSPGRLGSPSPSLRVSIVLFA